MRKLCSLIAIAAFILNGCSQELEVKTADSITTEYGEELENNKLYDAKESDENVTVKKVDGYDAKKLGEQTLDVIFTDGNKETEKQIKVKVEDTQKPVIELKKETITITAGDKLTLKDNVKSVKDPIDGELKYSSKKIEKSGYYIDTGKLDTDKTGTYEVKVMAYDANGNSSEKAFRVIVKKKETSNTNTGLSNNTTVPQQPASSNDGNSGNIDNSNGSSGGGSTSSNPGNSQSNVLCPGGFYPEKACDVIISHPDFINNSTGVTYDTWEQADAAGYEMLLNDPNVLGYNVYSIKYNDGTMKYVIHIHQQ